MNLSKELVAASATPIILAILQSNDSYGYAIIRKVQAISHNEIAWTDGMLYPVLHRLESTGLIESYWEKADNGRRRKYYRITEEGLGELEILISQWQVVNHALQTLKRDQMGDLDNV